MICMVVFEDETASFVEVEKLAASLRTIPLYSLESLTGLSKLSILMPIQYELSGRYYFIIEIRGKTKQNKTNNRYIALITYSTQHILTDAEVNSFVLEHI